MRFLQSDRATALQTEAITASRHVRAHHCSRLDLACADAFLIRRGLHVHSLTFRDRTCIVEIGPATPQRLDAMRSSLLAELNRVDSWPIYQLRAVGRPR